MKLPLAGFLLLVCTSASYSQHFEPYERSTTSTIKEEGFSDSFVTDGIKTSITNRSYQTTEKFLLLQEITNIFMSGYEGSESSIRLTAMERNRHGPVKWVISDAGDRAVTSWKHYRTTMTGCCGATDGHTLYALRDGRKLFSYDGELLRLSSKETRLIGLLSTGSMLPKLKSGAHPEAFAVISYAVEDSLRWQVVLEAPGDFVEANELWWPANLSITRDGRAEMPSRDPDSIYHTYRVETAFEIRLDYFGNTDMTIAITNDTVDVSRSQHSDSVRMTIRGLPGYLSEERFTHLARKSPSELRLLRNEVFARYGHEFDDPELREFFGSQPWYRKVDGLKISVEDLVGEEANVVRAILEIEQQGRPRTE